jgi:hypothetical protein
MEIRSLYPQGINPGHQLIRSTTGPQGRFGHFGRFGGRHGLFFGRETNSDSPAVGVWIGSIWLRIETGVLLL